MRRRREGGGGGGGGREEGEKVGRGRAEEREGKKG